MKHLAGHSMSIMLMWMCMASSALGEQKKCILLNAGENIDEFRDRIAEECVPGDVLYYRGTVGADIRVILAATVCDFSKSIVLGADELACVYNGTASSR